MLIYLLCFIVYTFDIHAIQGLICGLFVCVYVYVCYKCVCVCLCVSVCRYDMF